MNKKKLIFFIGLLIILISYATFVLYFNSRIHQVREVPIIFEVKNKLGIGLFDGNELNFGIAPRGSSSTRTFNITSNKDADVLMIAKGNASNFITFSENNFFLPKDEIKRLSAYLNVPADAGFGNYSGRLIIILRNV